MATQQEIDDAYAARDAELERAAVRHTCALPLHPKLQTAPIAKWSEEGKPILTVKSANALKKDELLFNNQELLFQLRRAVNSQKKNKRRRHK